MKEAIICNWIVNRIKKYSIEEGKDFLINLLKSQGGRPSKKYFLTLAMVENNEKEKDISLLGEVEG